MKRNLHVPLSLIALLSLGALPAHAVFFVNGSFENVPAAYVDIPGADRDGNTAAPGWTIASETPDWMWGEGPAGLWNTPEGDYFALGAATGTGFREGVKQTVSGFTVGASYELTFIQANGFFFSSGAGYEGVGLTGGWEVFLNGSSTFIADSVNGNETVSLDYTSDWFTRNYTFVAPTTDIEFIFLAFLNPQEPQQLPTFQFLDAVAVAPIPEPSTSAVLLGLAALTGMAGHRRIRRSRNG